MSAPDKPASAFDLSEAPRPTYVDRLPPCNHACPAGENIQEWLHLAQAERYEDAWRVITRDNPLPAIHGRCRTAGGGLARSRRADGTRQ